MKIRNGFVSNSSSSSFCIYGANISKDQIEWEDESDDFIDFVEDRAYKMGLEVHYNPLYTADSVSVGRSWSSVKDDETGKQFKDDVVTRVKEFMGDDSGLKYGTIEEAWYDG